MTSTTRIYAVTPKTTEGKAGLRLIRASNQPQALRHVAKDTLQVTVASQDDIVNGMTAGIPVEVASESEPTATQQ